jgi:phage I-like protein
MIPRPQADGRIYGIDGRSWTATDLSKVVTTLNSLKLDLPIDYNHASEIKARMGEESPSAGWMKAGTYRLNASGEICVDVEWTPRGLNSVESKEYRYISPAILSRGAEKQIVSLSSAALVPKPNLQDLPALNHQNQLVMNEEQLKSLCAALGVADNATPEAVIAAATQTRADLNAAREAAKKPDLNHFTPKADYELALNRAQNAEASLATIKADKLKAEAAQLVDDAVTQGKIAPASKEFYLGLCSDSSGVEKLRTHLKSAPALIPEGQRLQNPPPANAQDGLSAESLSLCAAFGNTPEDLKKFGK